MDGSQVDEIAELLDQCSPEELASILATIEGGGEDVPPDAAPAASAPLAPVPPSSPPPQGSGRRPPPNGIKKAEGGGYQEVDRQGMMDEVKTLLQQHSAGMMDEVRKLMPSLSSSAGGGGDAVDMGTLAKALSERDNEVQTLEARLAALQADLASKDKRVADLGGDLDTAMREVRHRQLDLEFQQLKLEERVRSNAELEQQQRTLMNRVEEASLNARHAAIDATAMTPRTMRMQGNVPWVLRKRHLANQ